MKFTLIISGSGGQGVMSIGMSLAGSAVEGGLHATFMPLYGPEQRGGTANVTVILSDKPISSPVLDEYDCVVALNQQSLDKFEPKVKKGGTLLYDPYGIHRAPTRPDINAVAVPAMEATFEMGNSKTFNMIVLGGLLKLRPVVSIESVIKALRKTLPERHHHLIPMNEEAIRIGMEIIKPQ